MDFDTYISAHTLYVKR